jgi:oligopeptide transport system ATP-binding protein
VTSRDVGSGDVSRPAPTAQGALPLADAPAFLDVSDLHVHYSGRSGLVRAVDGVNFAVAQGEAFALVGESGCGKSSTGRAIVQLEHIASGRINLDGIEISALRGKALRSMRRRFQMVFQDPFTSLDPRLTVGAIIREPLEIHRIGDRASRRQESDELLRTVGLDEAFDGRLPRQLSGGQRQRVGIARALVLKPDLLVCDEPISALDVSIQAQILTLLEDLQARFQLTIVFIAHDLAVVRHLSDRVAVMYLGKLIEIAPVDGLFGRPLHPYTQALISAAPIPNTRIERKRKRIILTGDVPSPINPPSGCRFRTRCPYARARCAEEEPLLRTAATGHVVACHFFEEIEQKEGHEVAGGGAR